MKARAKPLPVPTCRVCGCTDADCSGCIKRTGFACYWVEPDLCSACPRCRVEACPAGHPYVPGSFIFQRGGKGGWSRLCRQCNAVRAKAWRAKQQRARTDQSPYADVIGSNAGMRVGVLECDPSGVPNAARDGVAATPVPATPDPPI